MWSYSTVCIHAANRTMCGTSTRHTLEDGQLLYSHQAFCAASHAVLGTLDVCLFLVDSNPYLQRHSCYQCMLHAVASTACLLVICSMTATVDQGASLICIRTPHQQPQCYHALMACSNPSCWSPGHSLTSLPEMRKHRASYHLFCCLFSAAAKRSY